MGNLYTVYSFDALIGITQSYYPGPLGMEEGYFIPLFIP